MLNLRGGVEIIVILHVEPRNRPNANSSEAIAAGMTDRDSYTHKDIQNKHTIAMKHPAGADGTTHTTR
jgi:hypothetical protein